MQYLDQIVLYQDDKPMLLFEIIHLQEVIELKHYMIILLFGMPQPKQL
jgi:hypothetical protein